MARPRRETHTRYVCKTVRSPVGALTLVAFEDGLAGILWENEDPRATYHFYQNRMRVISLAPQGVLLTSGPYRFSRNPLYLGGNAFIFFGAGLVLGSPMALAITALHLPLVDLFIRREEQALVRDFGETWTRYKRSVRRWI